MPAPKRTSSRTTTSSASKPAAKRTATAARSGAKGTATSAKKATSRTATQAKSGASKTAGSAKSGAAKTKRAASRAPGGGEVGGQGCVRTAKTAAGAKGTATAARGRQADPHDRQERGDQDQACQRLRQLRVGRRAACEGHAQAAGRPDPDPRACPGGARRRRLAGAGDAQGRQRSGDRSREPRQAPRR